MRIAFAIAFAVLLAAVPSARGGGVNLHIIEILSKLGASNRTEAVAIALRKHLLKL